MKNLIAGFFRDESGQDLIEYALLGSFVSIAALLGAQALGTNLNSWYNGITTRVDIATKALKLSD